MPTLASPQAFEFCEGGTCPDAKPTDGNKHVICPPSDTCNKSGCYCQLFKRRTPKDKTEDPPWEVAHEDHKGNTKYRPADLDYKCFCVKPILEHDLKVDDVVHTLRYQLCPSGACTLDIIAKDDEMKCSGACEGECKCTMFRLKFADKDPKNAKWERVAKADKKVKPEDGYIYRCFCVK